MAPDSLESLPAPPVYRRHPGDAGRVYRDLCRALSGRPVDWTPYRPEDWDLLAQMARPENEGVGPLLHHSLQQAGWPPEMPGPVRQGLESGYYKTVAHNTLLAAELGAILSALEKAGLAPIVLKGAALIGDLYPDIGLRPMGDLDLLLPKHQIAGAAQVLADLGYLPDAGGPALRPDFQETFHIEVHFHKPGGPECLVELHWDLLGGESSRLQADLGWFLARLAPLELPGVVLEKTRALNPEANLLFLSAHLMLKHWMLKREGEKHARLLWFYDLFRLADQAADSLDWAAAHRAALDFKWEPAFLGALYGAVARFGRQDPRAYLTGRIGPLDGPSLARAKALAMLDDRKNYRYAQMTLPAAIKFFWQHFFPSPAYMRWRYRPKPAFLWPFFYPLRWVAGIRSSIGGSRKGEV